jgi:ATP synthase protein I
MSSGTNDDGEAGSGGSTPSEEAALTARRGQLDRRLTELRGRRGAEPAEDGGQGSASARASAMAVGLRLSSELVAGVLVGAVLGWGFDRLLSTSPWGLIVFLLLGFAAGVINVVRSSGAGR